MSLFQKIRSGLIILDASIDAAPVYQKAVVKILEEVKISKNELKTVLSGVKPIITELGERIETVTEKESEEFDAIIEEYTEKYPEVFGGRPETDEEEDNEDEEVGLTPVANGEKRQELRDKLNF